MNNDVIENRFNIYSKYGQIRTAIDERKHSSGLPQQVSRVAPMMMTAALDVTALGTEADCERASIANRQHDR